MSTHADEQTTSDASTLQLVIDSVPAFISFVDSDERYRLINRRYAEYFRVPADQIVGKHLREIQPPEAYAGMEPHIRAALSGKGVHYELNPKGPDGSRHWFDVQYIPRKESDGSVSGFFVMVADITARKNAEDEIQRAKVRAEEANRTKDRFLAFLGHELRNPLAPIRNSVEILMHPEPSPAELAEARDVINRQVSHMSRLIDDLLDISRLEQGKIVLRIEVVDLVEQVKNVISDHRAELETAGIELKFQPPPDPIWLLCDSVRLAQIVGNLLSNAGKFTDRGGCVTIKLSRTSQMQATISVSDTGIGMDESALAYIFKPFAQSEHSKKRSHGGLGIGLSLVRGLAELHGGTVCANSPGIGKGSEFIVTLPGITTAPEAKAESPKQARVDRSRRVLIIEDNIDAAESLGTLLRLHGHAVYLAESGSAGLQLARAHKPDVIFCDIELLDEMNGYEVAKSIRADAALRSTCLVAMTGYGQKHDRDRAMEAGFNRHLTKPAETKELMEILLES